MTGVNGKNNIKMYLKGINGLDSPGSSQGLVANFCEHGNEPSDSIKDQNVSSIRTTISFS
jgi:hypothetical protein